MTRTLHDPRFDTDVEVPDEAYLLDAILAHHQRTRPTAEIKDLVMHPVLAERSAGGCEKVRAWCAAHGIRPHLTTWAPRSELFLGNLDAAAVAPPSFDVDRYTQ